MRTACVLIPSFPVAVERQADPSLAETPVVVFDHATVLDATGAGTVGRGLPLRQAKALCPHTVFLEANHARYREVSGAMLDALERVAPEVEPAAPGCAYADVRGLHGHYEDEFALAGALVQAALNATGLLACAGVADGKFVSWVAASISPPGDAGVVAPGREREFLRDKAIGVLPFDQDVLRQLDLLALRTLGDIAALPRPAVEAEFRSAGRRLWELANGIDGEPLRPRKRQESLRERISFEVPVVATEALIAAGRQIVARLVRKLRGRTARRMQIELLTEGRIVWERWETFREPTGDEARMLLILKTRLSLLELPQGIDTVAITLTGLGREVGKQAKLFSETQPNLNQLAEAIGQLRARYGRDVVGRVMEVDPWSRHPEERSVLVPYDA